MEDIMKVCLEVVDLSRKVGFFLMEEKDKLVLSDIQTKGKHDYVTYVDKTAEKMIVEGLLKMFPKAGFITEEGTSNIRDDIYNWIVDPLDGTTNYIHGLAPFAVSIALQRNDEIIMGVVYEPNLNEVFYAWEGSEAFLNARPITVSNTIQLDNSLLATGFPYSDYDRLDEYMKVFEYCLKNTRGVRRLGSAATDLAYVACGRMDGFFEYGLSPWDVAAGAFILQRAGGIVTGFSGNKNYIYGKEILAFNNNLHQSFKEVVSEFF